MGRFLASIRVILFKCTYCPTHLPLLFSFCFVLSEVFNNSFTGTIPESIFDAPNLAYLYPFINPSTSCLQFVFDNGSVVHIKPSQSYRYLTYMFLGLWKTTF